MEPRLFAAALLAVATAFQTTQWTPEVLPGKASAQLVKSLDAARPHARHVWRDVPPRNADGTVNAYIEIARGDRRKWELDMAKNARAIDRMIPETIGGYAINYGIVPQTVSYDGDPFDALVLGPAIAGGTTVRGIVVGVMYMEDEKGIDSKVVLSRPGRDGKPLHQLTKADQQRVADYFNRYKTLTPGAHASVPGWGTIAEGNLLIDRTHAFFLKCRTRPGEPCSS